MKKYTTILIFLFLISCDNKEKKDSNDNIVTHHHRDNDASGVKKMLNENLKNPQFRKEYYLIKKYGKNFYNPSFQNINLDSNSQIEFVELIRNCNGTKEVIKKGKTYKSYSYSDDKLIFSINVPFDSTCSNILRIKINDKIITNEYSNFKIEKEKVFNGIISVLSSYNLNGKSVRYDYSKFIFE